MRNDRRDILARMTMLPSTHTELSAAELGAWRGMLRVHTALLRALDAELDAAHGLPLTSYDVLIYLKQAPRKRLRMAELADSVLLSRSGVTRLVDRLEREGLLVRDACDDDGRGLYAVLTRKGEDLLERARPDAPRRRARALPEPLLRGGARADGRLLGARAAGLRRRLDTRRLRSYTAGITRSHPSTNRSQEVEMTIVRWEPIRELSSLQSDMNRFFDAMFQAPAGGGQAAQLRRWTPAMDLAETEDAFVLRADLPGVSQEDVSIELEDTVLTVSGERKSDHENKGEGYYRVERAFGAFSRSLTLPKGVDAEAIAAQFTDGVLEVRIPKPEQRKPRRIAINGEPRELEANAA